MQIVTISRLIQEVLFSKDRWTLFFLFVLSPISYKKPFLEDIFFLGVDSMH